MTFYTPNRSSVFFLNVWKKVRVIFVNIELFNIFYIAIACKVVAVISDTNTLVNLMSQMRECRPEKARTDDEVIVVHSSIFFLVGMDFYAGIVRRDLVSMQICIRKSFVQIRVWA